MGKYLDLKRKVGQSETLAWLASDVGIRAADQEAQTLKAAGWKLHGRDGRIIWNSPVNGHWYSKEVVSILVEREHRRSRKRGKRDEVTQRRGAF